MFDLREGALGFEIAANHAVLIRNTFLRMGVFGRIIAGAITVNARYRDERFF